MGTAFSDEEIITLKKRLKEAGQECLARYGMRKTTVEELASKAGISTGAFYRFYPSKELLFFEILEDAHDLMYSRALSILTEHPELPQTERLARTFLDFFDQLPKLGISNLWGTELDYLLRKIPSEVMQNHWSDDKTHCRELIEKANLRLTVSADEATDIISALTMAYARSTLVSAGNIRPALVFLVRATCKALSATD